IICFRLGKLRMTKHLTAGDKKVLEDGFPEMLCSPLNIGLKEPARVSKSWGKRLDYTIEALPSQKFEKQVNAIESRRKAPGGLNYVRIFEKRVEQLYDEIIAILQAYLKKVHLPFARISERSGSGGPGFLETSGVYARAHGANLRRLPVHIIPPRTGFTAFAEESDLCLLRPPVAQVPEMRDLQQEEDDLRDGAEPKGGGLVAELDDRPAGGNGLPLLDAGEGAPAGQPVLPDTETSGWNAPGVDW
ncbi:MAG: hypothetical protein L0312_31120, partial [Acidobacteria bacterium]|nr:hypothetical protein [Acidobacteriota bacterium]